ncbi:MAG: disulfide bond formation protein B [Glaciimonas sp.]|nr:disulfide bond formation protein B [Glaciimonas sp.]
MNSSKSILLSVAAIALAIVGAALYLQHIQGLQPCPLCVLQRYAFVAIALICLVCAGMPSGVRKAGAGFGIVAALSGAATAGWHLWVIANPSTDCGRDALEAPMNALPMAKLLPSVFQVDAFALCSTPYNPILGLSIPQWSLVWFVVIIVILLMSLFKRDHTSKYPNDFK